MFSYLVLRNHPAPSAFSDRRKTILSETGSLTGHTARLPEACCSNLGSVLPSALPPGHSQPSLPQIAWFSTELSPLLALPALSALRKPPHRPQGILGRAFARL